MSKSGEIPIEAIHDSLCGNCNGACCQQGIILELSDAEHDFMVSRGAELVYLDVPTRSQEEEHIREILGDHLASVVHILVQSTEHPKYVFNQDCPNLSRPMGMVAFCTAYNDPDKPAICSSFTSGAKACLRIRASRFNDPSVSKLPLEIAEI